MPKPAYGRGWRQVRLFVLERDGYQCRIRFPGCLGRADQVDHIQPASLGGAHLDPLNLRAACHRCNESRGDGRQGSGATKDFGPSRAW
jgi:5-methylcytosine-specific restriction protein A